MLETLLYSYSISLSDLTFSFFSSLEWSEYLKLSHLSFPYSNWPLDFRLCAAFGIQFDVCLARDRVKYALAIDTVDMFD